MSGQDSQILLSEQYRVDFDAPLPLFDTKGGKAYGAIDTDDSQRPLYALVGRGRLPRRERVLEKLIQDPVRGCIRPLLDTIVALPEGGQTWAVVVERPEGGAFSAFASAEPFEEDILRRILLPQLVATLEGLEERGLVHRSIRPNRLFWREARGFSFVLGDCFSEPPACGQPAVYEPIERATAMQSGRGEGAIGCDLYALGVTLVSLLLGPKARFEKPGKTPYEARLVRGTADLLTKGLPVSPEMKRLLTGLLQDDPKRRWSLADLRSWTRGAEPTLAKAKGEKSQRSIHFSGESYWDRRLLARALSQANPTDAEQFARSEEFVRWVRNGLEDSESAREIQAVLAGEGRRIAQGLGPVVAIQRILDPIAPLRFGSLTLAADGIGPALAETWDERDSINAFAKIFRSGLVSEAAEGIEALIPDGAGLLRRLTHIQSLILRTAPGFGMERALYELNPGLPCRSPLLEGLHAVNPQQLVRALDERAQEGSANKLVDRHVAAFLAAREASAQYFLAPLEAPPTEAARILAEIALMSYLQRHWNAGPLLGLTAWFAAECRRITDAFHSASRRAAAEKVLGRLGQSGDLAQLEAELDLERWIQEDETAFRAARRHFRANAVRMRALSEEISPLDPEAQSIGHTGAIMAAYGILAVTALVTLLVP